MSSAFTPGKGFFVREPSWHRLEGAVLADWPGTWAEARVAAQLEWEPVTGPVYERQGARPMHIEARDLILDLPHYEPIHGWQQISRSDNDATLAVQPDSYRVITNSDFGYVIESVMGMDLGEEMAYEGVFELYGGRLVMAVVYFADGLQVNGDPSQTMTYVAFASRHDGQGGLKGVPTNVRVVCANTWALAGGNRESVGFTIRHTKNWDTRVAAVRDEMLDARARSQHQVGVFNQLSARKITKNTMDRAIRQFLPVGDDMSLRQSTMRENEREKIREILGSPTTADLGSTPYAFLQAAGEWVDHARRYNSTSSYTSRQLFTREPMKDRALRIAKTMAKVK